MLVTREARLQLFLSGKLSWRRSIAIKKCKYGAHLCVLKFFVNVYKSLSFFCRRLEKDISRARASAPDRYTVTNGKFWSLKRSNVCSLSNQATSATKQAHLAILQRVQTKLAGKENLNKLHEFVLKRLHFSGRRSGQG